MAIARTALKRYYMQVSHALSHWVSANCTVLTMGRRHLREQILVLGLLAAEQEESKAGSQYPGISVIHESLKKIRFLTKLLKVLTLILLTHCCHRSLLLKINAHWIIN